MYAVRLTEKGAAVLRNAEPAARTTDERILSALPVAQRDAFLEALAIIVDTMGVPTGEQEPEEREEREET